MVKKLKFAVLGDPIEHSLSPEIHKEFAEQFELSITYERLKTTKNALSTTLNRLIKQKYTGVNITVPLKEDVFLFASQPKFEISDRAMISKSINTVSFNRCKFFADNTDGAGLVAAVSRLGIKDLAGKNILILGVGGATKGILEPLLRMKPKTIHLANRSLERLRKFRNQFTYKNLLFHDIQEFKGKSRNLPQIENGLDNFKFDVIVNATSLSLIGGDNLISNKWFEKCFLAIDLMYSKKPTSFMMQAMEQNVNVVIDGLPMLVEQAAESFSLWTGLKPETEHVHAVAKKLIEL
ncbi:MAG: shikimate dehydrogenase [Betaproteobacteria bacterium TMED82]|nr:MAG: shikimate dehydrogenase [Betaproteobacteria bacterium TMED82]|tara:strand:- start:70284 stop:71165 length:882 start_codon:yes stop_codon:yes gene_type:complete